MSNFTSLATLSEKDKGLLVLAGQLDYRNGNQLSKIGADLIKKSSATSFVLDCSGVTRTSSVGLSLILSLIRYAKKIGKPFVIKSLTTDLEEIAKFSGVFEILPLDNSFAVVD